MSADVLSRRALNRATLERQLLLRRHTLTPLEALEQLVGLQAQVPTDPYVALWSRLDAFRPESLEAEMVERRAVRIAVMRGTIHLVAADDALILRPLMQPVLDAELARHRDHAPMLAAVDLEPVLSFARELFAERPRTGPELRAAFAERFPAENAAALAFACRNLLACVQVPPRGLWSRSGQVTTTTVEAWLSRPLSARPSIDDVVLRYVAAFGPAAVADVAAWCRLTGLREVVERLRPRLRAFRDEAGRELFDLPIAPRPDEDTPAPARFLPEYDNVLLSHADRTRFGATDVRSRLARAGGLGWGTVLHDGETRAVWRIDRATSTLEVRHLGRLPKRAAGSIAAEGRRLLRSLSPVADGGDVRFVELD